MTQLTFYIINFRLNRIRFFFKKKERKKERVHMHVIRSIEEIIMKPWQAAEMLRGTEPKLLASP
jgi:hypothetical protein